MSISERISPRTGETKKPIRPTPVKGVGRTDVRRTGLNAYVRFRQRHKPRKAPRLFYTLELTSALALAWWIDHWPRQDGIWVPLGFVLGAWLGARSEWPLRRGGSKDTSSRVLGSLAALAGFEFARELKHHHDLQDKSTDGPR